MKRYIAFLFLLMTSVCTYAEENMELLISSEKLEEKISEAADTINRDYKDKELTVVMIMKGSICMTADLIRKINIPFKLEYIKASSYGYNGMNAGTLTVGGLENAEIENRDILLVDDIFETGKTMLGVIDVIKQKNPRSIKTLLLLVKDIPRKTQYRPDYTLFNIPDRFVIGYGLDYKEFYRGLPGIYAFIDDTPPF